jgi:hypothetical protein
MAQIIKPRFELASRGGRMTMTLEHEKFDIPSRFRWEGQAWARTEDGCLGAVIDPWGRAYVFRCQASSAVDDFHSVLDTGVPVVKDIAIAVGARALCVIDADFRPYFWSFDCQWQRWHRERATFGFPRLPRQRLRRFATAEWIECRNEFRLMHPYWEHAAIFRRRNINNFFYWRGEWEERKI